MRECMKASNIDKCMAIDPQVEVDQSVCVYINHYMAWAYVWIIDDLQASVKYNLEVAERAYESP